MSKNCFFEYDKACKIYKNTGRVDCHKCIEDLSSADDWSLKEPEFSHAREHLEKAEEIYKKLGDAGSYTFERVIKPLRERVDSGEIGIHLYDDIMELKI